MPYIQKQKRRSYDKDASHTSYALYYHLVWGTKNALPFINQEVEELLRKYLTKKCNELEAAILEIGFVENHLHCLISLKPIHFIPDVIKTLKGSSSHFLNETLFEDKSFQWGRGYSIRTVSEKNLDIAKNYIKDQKVKHKL
jgi:putative transposase